MKQRVLSAGTRQSQTTPDGRAVIAREHNTLAPHPAPSQGSRLVSSKGINKILVESEAINEKDGVELYECDPCGWVAETAISVRAHLSSHNPSKNEPDYDIKTMRTLVATVLKYKRARTRGYCEKAAAELNTIGVKRRDGEPWKATNISHCFNAWKDRPEVKRSRNVSVSEEKAIFTPKIRRDSPISPHAPILSEKTDHPVAEKLLQLAAEISRAAGGVANLAREIAKWPILADSAEDIEVLRAKAAQYDQIAGALRGIGDLPR